MEGIKLNVNDLYLNALLPQIEKILEKEGIKIVSKFYKGYILGEKDKEYLLLEYKNDEINVLFSEKTFYFLGQFSENKLAFSEVINPGMINARLKCGFFVFTDNGEIKIEYTKFDLNKSNSFENGIAIVGDSSGSFWIDSNFNEIFQGVRYPNIVNFSGKIAGYKNSEFWTIIDIDGKIIKNQTANIIYLSNDGNRLRYSCKDGSHGVYA